MGWTRRCFGALDHRFSSGNRAAGVVSLALAGFLLAGCASGEETAVSSTDAPTDGSVAVGAEAIDAAAGLFGEDLVDRFCSDCHGSHLGGGSGPPLGPDSNAISLTDGQIVGVLDGGHATMPSFEGLSDEQVSSVIAYLRTVQAAEVAKATNIVDGDTLEVAIEGGGVDKVRLIGIDAPEEGECGYGQAKHPLVLRLGGATFTMTADVSERDEQGRLLRYLWLADGTFVNEWMVRSGFAIAHDYPPDSAYADRLAAAQAVAELEQVGMWASDWC